jgi:orotate phosphoribosyltransferase
VQVHVIDCERLAALDDDETLEKWIDLKWTPEAQANAVSVGGSTATVRNEPGVLAEIGGVLSGEAGGNISDVHTLERTKDFFTMSFDVEVFDARHLSNIVAALKTSDRVISVQRARSAGFPDAELEKRLRTHDCRRRAGRVQGGWARCLKVISSCLPACAARSSFKKRWSSVTARGLSAFAKRLADKIEAAGLGPFTAIVSPAMGGIIPGYETARQMGLPFMFVEREKGEFALRRGFELTAADRVLVIEDIVTTGLSSRECIAAIEKSGAKVTAEAVWLTGLAARLDVGAPLCAWRPWISPLIRLTASAELERIPAMKPGSRGLA